MKFEKFCDTDRPCIEFVADANVQRDHRKNLWTDNNSEDNVRKWLEKELNSSERYGKVWSIACEVLKQKEIIDSIDEYKSDYTSW